MRIEPLFHEPTFTLTYLVFDEATRDAIVIDPVLDFDPASGKVSTEALEKLARAIDERGLRVHWVLETHVHADHLSGSDWLKKKYGAGVAISERVVEVQRVFQGIFELQELRTDGGQFDRLLKHGEVLRAGPLAIEVRATPGHTPACTSFVVGDAVFTGDALFLDDIGVGRCDFPRGDAAALYDSVTKQLWTLPDDTRVFVGHDYPPSGKRSWQASTTIGASKRSNAQLNERLTRAGFIEQRTARDRTLSAPRLLYPSVQVNVDAGRFPSAGPGGQRFLKIPLQGLAPTGQPAAA